MPLQLVAPPPEVLATYQASLIDFLGPHKPEVKLFHLPVGTLGLAELAKGATLKDIVPSGCRFFAAWPDGNVTSCEMTDPTLYGQAKFRNIVQGDLVHTPFTRIIDAHDLAQVQTADFKLQFLSIPGIYFEALHVVCLGQGTDLVLPLLSSDLEMTTDAVLDAETFLAKARPIAAARFNMARSSPLSS